MKRISLFLAITLCTLLSVISSCKKDNNNKTTTCGGSSCSAALQTGETAGTTPSGIIGKHSLTYDEIQVGGPFKAGDKVDIELTSDNKMIVTFNGDCITLSNPAQTSPKEVSFRDDCKHNVRFSASENTSGKINEVNITSLSKVFYGQFK